MVFDDSSFSSSPMPSRTQRKPDILAWARAIKREVRTSASFEGSERCIAPMKLPERQSRYVYRGFGRRVWNLKGIIELYGSKES